MPNPVAPAVDLTEDERSQLLAWSRRSTSVPIEGELLAIIDVYLESRATQFPDALKRKAATPGPALSRWPARTPLFVGRDGDRITRGILQSRIKRAFKRAGPDAQPVPGALVHGLRLPTLRNSRAPTSVSTPS